MKVRDQKRVAVNAAQFPAKIYVNKMASAVIPEIRPVAKKIEIGVPTSKRFLQINKERASQLSRKLELEIFKSI